jgi:hypothetical protein
VVNLVSLVLVIGIVMLRWKPVDFPWPITEILAELSFQSLNGTSL